MRLLFVMIACGFIYSNTPAFAADANDTAGAADIWKQMDNPVERANTILDRIAKTDPNLAAHLRQLQSSNPQQFHTELRTALRGQFKNGMAGQYADFNGMGQGTAGQRRPKHGEIQGKLEERHNAYVSWLEKNYPEEAAQLATAKEKQPEQYFHCLKNSLEKYGRIAQAEKEGNTALAKVFRDDLELKVQTDKVLDQLRSAKDDAQKKAFKDELGNLVAKRFDLIVQQKQLRYQDLNKRLENMKLELRKQESELGKLKARKDQEVPKRVEELINKTQELKWD